MCNFWLKFKKRIYALAPMAGVTDSAFRLICKKFGADVVYSEMASAASLAHGSANTLSMLKFSSAEQPYVVQLFGHNPDHFACAAKLITAGRIPLWRTKIAAVVEAAPAIRPAGIDINFGCPVKKVQKQGAGAVLMDNLKLAREIIKATVANTDLPVSLKCRTQAREVGVLEFLDKISDLAVAMVMIHGRSLAGGFAGPIDTEAIKRARTVFGGLILANGGIKTYDEAVEILERTQADGIGIARGALGRPWIFKAVRTGQSVERSRRAIFKIALEQARLAEELNGERGIIEMRKHLCWYVSGLPGARKMRREFVRVETIRNIEKVLKY